MAIRITCIRKSGGYHSDPHHAISSLNWINEADYTTGAIARDDLYDWIKRGGQAYVVDSRGNKAFVGTGEHGLTKFVRTYADGVWTDNLLALPECK